VLVLVPI